MPQPSSHELEQLIQELHRATERFHHSRMELEKWMDASEYRHQERVDAAEEQLRQAESELEQVNDRISQALASGGAADRKPTESPATPAS
jgi:hypothetical protein